VGLGWKAGQAPLKNDWEQDLQETIVYCFHSSICIISQHSKQQSGILPKVVGQGILHNLPLPFILGE